MAVAEPRAGRRTVSRESPGEDLTRFAVTQAFQKSFGGPDILSGPFSYPSSGASKLEICRTQAANLLQIIEAVSPRRVTTPSERFGASSR